jgi:hypothetical protein
MPEHKKAELINGIVYIPSSAETPEKPGIQPLQNGDHLTIEEFERRYESMPDVKKAELINGVVYMGSPVSIEYHGSPHGSMTGWLIQYHAYTPGTQFGDNVTLKLPSGIHRPQPDDVLRIRPERGGLSRTDSKGYVVGAVELAAEVAATSANIDLHDKKNAFEQNGILEYIVWRVEDEEIDWFILKRGKYQRLAKSTDGLYKSKVFPGLWLDPKALIAGDMVKVLEIVQKGIATPEHERFVKKLQARKK